MSWWVRSYVPLALAAGLEETGCTLINAFLTYWRTTAFDVAFSACRARCGDLDMRFFVLQAYLALNVLHPFTHSTSV